MRLLGLVPLALLLAACSSAVAATPDEPDIARCLTADGRSLEIERDVLDWARETDAQGDSTLSLDVRTVSHYQGPQNLYVHWGEYLLETNSPDGLLLPIAFYVVGTIDVTTCAASAVIE